jgi:hypothetical protein
LFGEGDYWSTDPKNHWTPLASHGSPDRYEPARTDVIRVYSVNDVTEYKAKAGRLQSLHADTREHNVHRFHSVVNFQAGRRSNRR